ncbi:MAG: DUF58 domain-containing protein, partial [Anaerovoracaceae bacterium]
MLKSRIFYGLLLVFSVFLYIFTDSYYTLTLLLVTAVLPLISFGLLLGSKKGLMVEIQVPFSMEKGGEMCFSYQMTNGSFFPAARIEIQLETENQLTFGTSKRKIYTGIGGKKAEELALKLKGASIGATVIRTKSIRLFDAFALFTIKKATPEDKITVVYPQLAPMELELEKPVENIMGEGSKYSTEKSGLDVSELFSLREYEEGDEIRKIHWKLSSKIDKTIVREFSLPLNYSVFLLIELVKVEEELMDKGLETFLSLSRTLLMNGVNHNLAWYDDGEGEFHVTALDVFEDLELAMADILAAFA